MTGNGAVQRQLRKDSARNNSADEIHEIAKGVVAEMLAAEDFIHNLAVKIGEVIAAKYESIIKEQSSEIAVLKADAAANMQVIDELKTKLDNLEQYTRRNSVRVFGIKEQTGEHTDDLVIKMFKSQLGVSMPINAIDRSHRVGKPTVGKDRPVLVKFASYRDKDLVYRKKSMCKGTRMMIKEDLTSSKVQLLKAVTEVINFRHVWTQDGTILVNVNNTKHRINSIRDLGKIQQLTI